MKKSNEDRRKIGREVAEVIMAAFREEHKGVTVDWKEVFSRVEEIVNRKERKSFTYDNKS